MGSQRVEHDLVTEQHLPSKSKDFELTKNPCCLFLYSFTMLYNFYNLFQLEGPIQESNTNARYRKKKKIFHSIFGCKNSNLLFPAVTVLLQTFPKELKSL